VKFFWTVFFIKIRSGKIIRKEWIKSFSALYFFNKFNLCVRKNKTTHKKNKTLKMNSKFVILFCLFCNSVLAQVLLREVQVLHFEQSQMTTGHRLSPGPQLKCTSRLDVCQKYFPNSAVCHNVGVDDRGSVIWDCTAALDEDHVRLGETEVSCEGWRGPDDPYILQGSCQLEFDLILPCQNRMVDEPEWAAPLLIGILVSILLIIVIGFFIFVVRILLMPQPPTIVEPKCVDIDCNTPTAPPPSPPPELRHRSIPHSSTLAPPANPIDDGFAT
jgi:hypothetical protein